MSQFSRRVARSPLLEAEAVLLKRWKTDFSTMGALAFKDLASAELTDEQCVRLRTLAVHHAARVHDLPFMLGAASAQWPDKKQSVSHHSPVSGVSIVAQPLFGAIESGLSLDQAEAILRAMGDALVSQLANEPVVAPGHDAANEPEDARRPLLLALEAADCPSLVRHLAAEGKKQFFWNEPVAARQTALGQAAASGRLESIDVLLALGATPLDAVRAGDSGVFIAHPPAREAAKHGQWEAMKRLAPLRFIPVANDKDPALRERVRMDMPNPRPLSSVENAKIWLHSVSCRVRSTADGESVADLLKAAWDAQNAQNEIQRSAQKAAASVEIIANEPTASVSREQTFAPSIGKPAAPKQATERAPATGFFGRLVGRRAKEAETPTPKAPPTVAETAELAFLTALSHADWPSARAVIDFARENGLSDLRLRRAGRPLAFFSMAMALAALDQEGSDNTRALRDRPLSRTGRIEPLAPYLSRPGRASFWQQLLALPDTDAMGRNIRAGFFEPDPAADGMRQVHWFALFNQPSGIEALARAGADIVCDTALDDAPSPIALAARAGCVEAMETLFRLGAPLESERTSVLLSAAENGEETVFERAAELLLAHDPQQALWAAERLAAWIASRRQEALPWVARRAEALQLAAISRQATPSPAASGDGDAEALAAAPRRASAHRL